MSFRVVVNLVTFVLLAVGLGWWALANHVTFGLVEPDHRDVTIEFAASPGLQPGFQVTYLGHGIGSVDRIELADDRVRVHASLDPQAPVPAGVRADVRRASAVGEPYVDLLPDGEVTGDTRLADGATIPLERTAVPLSYEEVFRSVAEVLEDVPGEALGGIVDELTRALDGREDELVAMLADTEDVLTTAADRADMLDELATRSTRLGAMLADLAPTAGAALDDLEPLVGAIAASRDELDALLDSSPGITRRTADLATRLRQPLACLLDPLETTLATVDTPETAAALDRAIDDAPALMALLRASTHERDGGPWLRVDPILNIGGTPLRTFDQPLPVPEAPATGTCSTQLPGLPAAAEDADVAPTPQPLAPEDVRPGGRPGQAPGASDGPTEAPRASSDQPGPRGAVPRGWALLGLGVLVLLATRPWRWLERWRGS